MLDVRPVAHILGLLACVVAIMLCFPAIADMLHGDSDWKQFVSTAMIAGIVGTVTVVVTYRGDAGSLNLRQAFLITVTAWITVSLVAAIPFLGLGMSLTDAVFESMSGITTTGSTVLTNLDSLPPGILLWRALLQWIGGIGIIALAILMLPLLRIGGMQIFKIESSDRFEERLTGVGKTVAGLFAIYVLLTVACAMFYFEFGMSPFDAVTHAMTTLSTGGYSTHDASFAYFKDMRIQWVATVFMISGSIPFYLYVKSIRSSARSIFSDQQVRGFIAFLIVTSVVMAYWLVHQRDIGFLRALTLTSFNVVSVVTTTGYASEDYTSWGSGAVGVFLILMFVGGCSGSTAGGIKIYRLQILYMLVRAHIKRLFSPNRMGSLRFNGNPLPEEVPYSILAFLAVYVATIAAFTVCLALMGLDIVTAYSATVTAIGNVGPGLGTVIGPSGNFEPLPDAAKWLLVVAMLAGRLEVLALLVVFDRDFWRF